MKFDTSLIDARKEKMIKNGFWKNRTIEHFFRLALETQPDKTAVVAYKINGKNSPSVRLSYRQLDERINAIAKSLIRLGIQRSDVVSFQIPNSWEFIAISLACARIGAVANPLMPIFRERELSYMLKFLESKVFIVPSVFKNFNYEEMAQGLLPKIATLQHIVVLGGEGENSFEKCLLTDYSTDPLVADPVGPDDILILLFTSGTTGEPKAVMHTSNTLLAALDGFVEALELNDSEIILGASPMAHLTGYGYLAMLPIVLNSTTVVMDNWDPGIALQIIKDEAVTFSMASSPFVQDMCNATEKGAPRSPQFTKFCCAGAPIPPIVIERAHQIMNLTVCSAWGMTENGAITITEPAVALEKSSISDGKAISGIELKIADGNGNELPRGETGRLLVRGASQCVGYYKKPELNALTEDDWFDSGDLAFISQDGYIRINGRSKDIVIRGAENIPVIEIENLLYQHPSINTVAIVGFPDERLGERACAFVTLKEGASFSFEEMRQYLKDKKVAPQYFPEKLEIRNDLPRTPSGKLQKFILRDEAKSFKID
ncbi:AMP-binding protein [Advenella sp. RU8]|uniref:AMP-binding protein n=1 Tax=Advenella sp. RU8 TaxID=3399575 RepID=UPI003AAC56CF